jgi:nickel/cobalt transporter (NicO) family protein
MRESLFFVASSFWAGAAHAATPGHGKTIAAAYIVGARGKPIDAVILGIFVTLSRTSGVVLVGVLASLGSTGCGHSVSKSTSQSRLASW